MPFERRRWKKGGETLFEQSALFKVLFSPLAMNVDHFSSQVMFLEVT